MSKKSGPISTGSDLVVNKVTADLRMSKKAVQFLLGVTLFVNKVTCITLDGNATIQLKATQSPVNEVTLQGGQTTQFL